MKLLLIILFTVYSLVSTAQDTPKVTVAISATTAVKNFIKAEVAKIKTIKGDAGKDGRDGINSNTEGTNYFMFAYKSVKDFGLLPGVDDGFAIQKCIDYCLANGIRTMAMPQGTYNTARSVVIFQPNKYSTLNIIGESVPFEAAQGTVWNYTGTDGFALGLQNNKGSKVIGIKFISGFQPPFLNDKFKFFNCKFDDFKDGICRDSRYSPHTAIAIDPFTNREGVPPDGGYPGLSKYYGASPNFSSQTGSTNILIEDCSFFNYVVALSTSVNGITRNAEMITYNKVQFENCKLCVATTQDQEKNNILSNFACWGGTHTIFANRYYGGSPSNYMGGDWAIEHGNLAGGVVRFMNYQSSGYYSAAVYKIFGESIGQFGIYSSNIAGSVSDCTFDFELPSVAGVQLLINSGGDKVKYTSCNFRYYGLGSARMYVNGTFKDDGCFWSGSVERNNSPISPNE